MWLRDRWHAYRLSQARHYLRRHTDLALDVLRQDSGLATQALFAAQMQVEAARGDPQRQSVQFPVLSTLGHGARNILSLTLPKAAPFNLRRFSEYPPARKAINSLKDPIIEQAWTIEPVPDPDLATHEDNTPTPEQHRRIVALRNVLQQPNAQESYRAWLGAILEDMIVGGYGASELQRTGAAERPVWLWSVDGQSIRLNIRWDGSDPEMYRYSQALGYVGLSVGTHDMVTLLDEELLYFKLMPRSNTPFGLGYLEVAFQTINAFMGAFEFAERRASNATPLFALFLGENVTFDQVRRWQQYWEQDIEGYGKVPILGGGRAPQVLPFVGQGEDGLWLKWQEWLIRVIAMAFGISPMRLGLERDVNRSTAESQDAQDWETVSPVANAFADYFTYKLLWQILGWTDLRFRWLVRDTDEKRQAEILREQWESDSITVNEQRRFWERPPLPGPLGELTKTAYEETLKAVAAQHAQPAAFGGPPPDEDPEDETPHVRDEEDALEQPERLAAQREGALAAEARRVLEAVGTQGSRNGRQTGPC